MKLVMLIDEGSLRRVRSAIERVDEVSGKTEVGRVVVRHGSRAPLDEAVQQLVASLRASFRILVRQK